MDPYLGFPAARWAEYSECFFSFQARCWVRLVGSLGALLIGFCIPTPSILPEPFPAPLFFPPRGLFTRGAGREHVAVGGS